MGLPRRVKPPRKLTDAERKRYQARYDRLDKQLSAAVENFDDPNTYKRLWKMNDLAGILFDRQWLTTANKMKVRRWAKKVGVTTLRGIPDPRFPKKGSKQIASVQRFRNTQR